MIGRIVLGVAGLWAVHAGVNALADAVAGDHPGLLGDSADERLMRAQRVIERLEEECTKLRASLRAQTQ